MGRQQIEPLEGGADASGTATRTYDDGQLSMWYSATATGLEQGFTLNRRPAGTTGAVTIAMASAGGLTPELTSPTSLSLLGHGGQAELNYSGLKVTDASHKVLPAHLETSGSSIRIAFDDQGATYPVRVDPYIELASLVPPTTASDFGTAVATSANGTTALVGDPYGGAQDTGAATVYTFANGSWSAGTALTLPRLRSALRYLRCPVGRRDDGARRRPQRGTHSPALRPPTRFNGTTWSAGTALTVPDTAGSFGTSVALSKDGSTALVGDPYGRRSIATGAATIFTGGGTSWSAGPPLDTSTPSKPNTFGTSVALSSNGSTALVGDPTGGSARNGAVTSYSSPSWTTKLALPLPGHSKAFGTSVRTQRQRHHGARRRSHRESAGTGAATIETLSGGAWALSALLAVPSAPVCIRDFGVSYWSRNHGPGWGPRRPFCCRGRPPVSTGTASIYTLSGTTWSGVTPLSPAIGAVTYGSAVALSYDGSTALVGDPTGGERFRLGDHVHHEREPGTLESRSGSEPPEYLIFVRVAAVALSTTGSTLLAGDPVRKLIHGGAASAYSYNGTSLSAGTALTLPASRQLVWHVARGFGERDDGHCRGSRKCPPGAATVYTFNGTTWSSGTALTPPDTAFDFGTSVAISAKRDNGDCRGPRRRRLGHG